MEEKRSYPRVKTKLKVRAPNEILADTLDLSEGGAKFSSTETISSKEIPLQINLGERKTELKTKAKLIWKRDLEGGGSVYGVEFVHLAKAQKEALREELIRTQISGLLEDISSAQIKECLSRFFLKDLLDYTKEIIDCVSHLAKVDEYSLELEKGIEHLNNQILLKGYSLELLLEDAAIMQRVKDNFRHLIGAWVYKGAILKQALDRPREYSPSYKVIEAIYDNQPISKNIGLYFDNNFLKSPYAVALRLRKDHIKKILQKFINETKKEKIHILNIAAGSCREIRELLPHLKMQSSIIFNCLDSDEEALKFAEVKLSHALAKNIEFKFIKEDVMNFIEKEDCLHLYGKQDMIYSISSIDYLPDEILKKLIPVLSGLLEPGGRLILTHKNREKTFPAIAPDWFCDWKFMARNKDEVMKLFYDGGFSRSACSVESDDFGYIHYFTLAKK